MAIEARQVCAGYGGSDILHGVDCHFRAGEFTGILGPNGSGKTTLLRTLSGVLSPRSGEVIIDSQAVSSLKPAELALRLAFVPQVESATFEFTVREAVLMGRHARVSQRRGEDSSDYEAAARAMALTDTLHLAERSITRLSGGEHRRVLLARALAQEAPNLLADEPAAHLDVGHQSDILGRLRAQADSGVVVAASLHDPNHALAVCDRVLVLSGGKVVAEGAPAQTLTPELIQQVFGTAVDAVQHPRSGLPYLIANASVRDASGSTGVRVHVVCGGGSGAELLGWLVRRGHTVTAGVLNRHDSDEVVAKALECVCASEAPYTGISEAAAAECRSLMEQAEAVIIAPVAFGRGNLRNLVLAQEAQRNGKQVILLGDDRFDRRDFTGGEAESILRELIEHGARVASDLQAVDEAIGQLIRQ
jgi:iron complex transport system ATP-binding protein